MVFSSGLERLLGWKRLPLYSPFGYVELIKYLIKKFLSFSSHLPVYWYSPFMVIAITVGNRELFTEVCVWLEATARDHFPNLGNLIIFGLDHKHLRCFVISHYDR
jgi:hypothetical protein